jgi:integrase
VARSRWQENDLIFPSSIGTTLDLRNLLRNFKEILKAAGLPDMRFHDLRHTAASLMLTHGIPVFTVARILGHTRASVTLDTYGHMIPGAQDQAARLMDELVTPVLVSVEEQKDRVPISADQEDDRYHPERWLTG